MLATNLHQVSFSIREDSWRFVNDVLPRRRIRRGFDLLRNEHLRPATLDVILLRHATGDRDALAIMLLRLVAYARDVHLDAAGLGVTNEGPAGRLAADRHHPAAKRAGEGGGPRGGGRGARGSCRRRLAVVVAGAAGETDQ